MIRRLIPQNSTRRIRIHIEWWQASNVDRKWEAFRCPYPWRCRECPIRSHGWELNIPDSVEITFWSASLDRDEHKIAKTVIAAVATAEPRICKGQRSVCLLSPRRVFELCQSLTVLSFPSFSKACSSSSSRVSLAAMVFITAPPSLLLPRI